MLRSGADTERDQTVAVGGDARAVGGDARAAGGDARAVGGDAPAAGADPTSNTPGSLHRRYFTDLVRTAALMTDDRFLAEEIVQDAFAELVSRWDRIDPERALGYLYRSVANGAKSALRRRRTIRNHRPDPERPEPGADATVLHAAGHEALLGAIARLPRGQRQVLVLRFFSELSVADTAAALGMSPTAVTAATHRAVSSLAQHREQFR